MNILFLANRFPYPPFRGDKLKIFNLCKRLSKRHKLYLLTFYEDKNELEYIKEISDYFEKIDLVYLPKWKSVLHTFTAVFSGESLQMAYFKSKEMSLCLEKILAGNNIDVIHTQHLRMTQYSKEVSNVPKIIDLPDAFSLYWKRRKTTQRKWYQTLLDHIEINRLVKAEKNILKYNLCLVCSKEDKIYLEKLHGAKNVNLLLNGVDLDTFDVAGGHNYASNNQVLFTGNMDYAPNVDAVVYFANEIWPIIIKRFPQSKFVIAGQRPVNRVKALESENIVVTGFVKNLAQMYSEASVLVSPLRFGAGTQNKVLEAMAMGLPVISTQIGFEGLGVNNGEGVIRTKGKEEFVEALTELLSNEEKRKSTGITGLEKARTVYSWDIIAQDLDKYFNELKINSNQ